MNVNGATPNQDKIARILGGIERMPAGEIRKMVDRAASHGKEIDNLLSEINVLAGELSGISGRLDEILKEIKEIAE